MFEIMIIESADTYSCEKKEHSYKVYTNEQYTVYSVMENNNGVMFLIFNGGWCFVNSKYCRPLSKV